MTGPKNVLPFFIILVFEILLFLYTQKGLSKKNSWMQNALWGILTWQPCGSRHTLPSHVTSNITCYLNIRTVISATQEVFCFFWPKHTLDTEYNWSYFLGKIFGIRACF